MRWTATFQPDTLPAAKWWQAINPYWLASDQERNMAWPWWAWFKRNMFANFTAVIIGVAHRPRVWVSTMGGENFPARGIGFGWVIADGCWLPRPWICYRGTALELGIGWKSHGGFGINRRTANTPNAGATPDAPTSPRVSDADAALELSQLRIAELEAEVRALHKPFVDHDETPAMGTPPEVKTETLTPRWTKTR